MHLSKPQGATQWKSNLVCNVMDALPLKTRFNRFSVIRLKRAEKTVTFCFCFLEYCLLSGFRFLENVIRCPSLVTTHRRCTSIPIRFAAYQVRINDHHLQFAASSRYQSQSIAVRFAASSRRFRTNQRISQFGFLRAADKSQKIAIRLASPRELLSFESPEHDLSFFFIYRFGLVSLFVYPPPRHRNSAPSRKGCVVNGQTTKASNK